MENCSRDLNLFRAAGSEPQGVTFLKWRLVRMVADEMNFPHFKFQLLESLDVMEVCPAGCKAS